MAASLITLAVLDLLTAAARAALLHANLPRLLSAREQDETKAERALVLLHSLPRAQASLNLAHLLLRFGMAWLVFVLVLQTEAASNQWISALALFLAALLLFWMEWIIEAVVVEDATTWALRLGLFARVLMALLSPFVSLGLFFSGNRQVVPDVSGPIGVTEDDLRTMMDAGEQGGLIEQDERKMIHSIIELGDTLAREIMVPRIDMLALDVHTPMREAVDAFLESGHSRVPVYEETVDNILGLLYAKDLLRLWLEGEPLGSLRPLLRRANFVPEAKKVDDLLAEMQSQRVHMAVVVDEYGGIAGLVTLEDIVEEIVGEIQDEYDLAEESPYEEVADGEYIFLGRIGLDDFNEITASNLSKDEADTLAGFMYSRLGRVPSSGESLQVDNLMLKAEQVIGRRIRKVRVKAAFNLSSGDERVSDVS